MDRFGQALLPIATQITPLITAAIQGLVGVLGVLAQNAVPVGAALGVVGVVVAATIVPPFIAWAAATLAATWPLIAIAAAVAGVVLVLQRLGILDVIISTLGNLAGIIMGVVSGAFNAL